MGTRSYIENWGVPECLEDLAIMYDFIDIESQTAKGAKFNLIDNEGTVFFSMDFALPSKGIKKLRAQKKDWITLHFIHVPVPEYRKKGISTFYLKKLLQYCIDFNIEEIRLNVAPNQRNLKGYSLENGMDESELKSFYEKHLGRNDKVSLFIENMK